jgi:hypothetical protein
LGDTILLNEYDKNVDEDAVFCNRSRERAQQLGARGDCGCKGYRLGVCTERFLLKVRRLAPLSASIRVIFYNH